MVHLGIALDGAGWHPSAWREPSARPHELFEPAYWTDIVRLAEEALADFVTIEDRLALQSADPRQPDARTDEVRGRLDALLIAARVAPATSHIGLIPTVTANLTEPFHIAKATATLDHIGLGRAGWQVKLNSSPEEWSQIDRERPGEVEALVAETEDVVEAVRRLWDSWEDDAEIRDAATDRFIDREKVHRIDFSGRGFSVRGPSIVPRSPQGQPVVAALSHTGRIHELAARAADIVFTTPGAGEERAVLESVRAAQARAGRPEEPRRAGSKDPLQVYADLLVLLDSGSETGAERLARLDARGRPLESDARIVTGSAGQLAELIAVLADAGYHGVRLRPGVLTDDLPLIARDLAPELQGRGLLRSRYPGGSLRGLLGLRTDLPSRYAGTRPVAS